LKKRHVGYPAFMSEFTDTDISTSPSEDDENLDQGTEGKDTGDEPTEADDDRDVGGEGEKDTGDQT